VDAKDPSYIKAQKLINKSNPAEPTEVAVPSTGEPQRKKHRYKGHELHTNPPSQGALAITDMLSELTLDSAAVDPLGKDSLLAALPTLNEDTRTVKEVMDLAQRITAESAPHERSDNTLYLQEERVRSHIDFYTHQVLFNFRIYEILQAEHGRLKALMTSRDIPLPSSTPVA
jgi:hypothetical protein